MKLEIDIPEAMLNSVDDIVANPALAFESRNTFMISSIREQLQKYRLDASRIINVYSDGACLGNPGPMGVGVWIPDFLLELSDFIGKGTNNIAEWTALLYATRAVLHKLKEDSEKIEGKQIIFHLDSELVVNQANGKYTIKNGNLAEIAKEVKDKIKVLKKSCDVGIQWIPREKNEVADSLSKRAAKTQTQIDDYRLKIVAEPQGKESGVKIVDQRGAGR